MWDKLELVSGPAIEPITPDEAKAQSLIDSDADDQLLQRLIRTARQTIEGPDGAGIFLVAQTWKLKLDCLPPEIWIPTGPVLSIDQITYVDDGGATQVLAADGYQWRRGKFEARIKAPYDGTFPTVRKQYDAVQVTFTAGFPGTNDSPPTVDMVPDPLRHALLLLVEHYYDNRDTVGFSTISEMPFGVSAILDRYRVGRL